MRVKSLIKYFIHWKKKNNSKELFLINELSKTDGLEDIEDIARQFINNDKYIDFIYKGNRLRTINEEASIYHLVNSVSKMEALVDSFIYHEGKVSFDIGANVGWFAYFFKKKYPESFLFIIEADKRLIPIIEYNLRLFENFIILNVAVSDKEGKDEFFINKLSSQTSSTEKFSVLPYTAGRQDLIVELVDNIDIKHFCVDNKITTIGVLKIDIQGGEFKALKNILSSDIIINNCLLEVCVDQVNIFELLDLIRTRFSKYKFINYVKGGGDISFFN